MSGCERAGDRRLLDDMLRDAAGERLDQRRGIARRVDDGAQVVARALRAVVEA